MKKPKERGPIRVQATCPLCGHVFETADFPDRCERCGGHLGTTKGAGTMKAIVAALVILVLSACLVLDPFELQSLQ